MKSVIKFPLTIFFLLLILFLSFFTPPPTDLDDVSNIDKIFHFLMYCGTMSVFWIEYRRYEREGQPWSPLMLAMVSVVLPILLSGLIELLQEYCTGGRRGGEWSDFAANSAGVLFAFFICRKIAGKVIRPKSQN